LKGYCVLQDHYDDERDKTVFHDTIPDLQDQDQDHSLQDQDEDQDRFLVSDRSCPKTDGLRPHHCMEPAATVHSLQRLHGFGTVYDSVLDFTLSKETFANRLNHISCCSDFDF